MKALIQFLIFFYLRMIEAPLSGLIVQCVMDRCEAKWKQSERPLIGRFRGSLGEAGFLWWF
jgi:hypothetical protein